MPKIVEKRIEMGTGFAYNMARRWVGIAKKDGSVCDILHGIEHLTGRYRHRQVRIVAEVLGRDMTRAESGRAYFFERRSTLVPDLVVLAQNGPEAWRQVREFLGYHFKFKKPASLRLAKDDYYLRKATLV